MSDAVSVPRKYGAASVSAAAGVPAAYKTLGSSLAVRDRAWMLANAVAQGAACGLELQTPFYSMGDAVSALIPRQNGGAFDSAVAGVLAAFEMQSCRITARDHEPHTCWQTPSRRAASCRVSCVVCVL